MAFEEGGFDDEVPWVGGGEGAEVRTEERECL